MHNYSLSNESKRLLEDNGYKFKMNEKRVLINRSYDYVGPVILFVLFGFVALPLFDYSYWLGALIFILLVVGVYLHRNLFSKASVLKISFQDSKVELKDKTGTRWFTSWYVRSLFLRSKFKSEYTSAFKSTSEEYLVSIGVELRSGEEVALLRFLSDYQEPTKEMNEVHDFLKSILSKTTDT